jgi:long-chain fatty acid transport protein
MASTQTHTVTEVSFCSRSTNLYDAKCLQIINFPVLQALFLVMCLLNPIWARVSFAGGPVQGAKAAGMGTAFVAVADDLSAILYNPAGLTQSTGTNIYNNGTLVLPSSEYKSPSGGSEKTKFQAFLVPQLSIASDFNTSDLRFGLGIYSPFGIGGRKWSGTGLTREVSTNNQIGTVAANPVFAWRASPWLSVGGGFYYQYAITRMEKMNDQSFVGAGDANSVLKGNGGGWGYNAGVLLFPGECVSFGFAYRSHSVIDQKMDFSISGIAPAIQPIVGGPSFQTGGNSSIDFPQVVSFGVGVRPTGKLTIAIDVDWGGWSSMKNLNLTLDRQVPQAGVTNAVIPLNMQNAWQPKVGLEYKLDDRFAVRCGYAFVQTNVPDMAVGPGNPDANQHGVSLGLGYKRGKFTFDFFYLADFYQNRSVSNDILSGDYKNFANIVGTSMNYKWK